MGNNVARPAADARGAMSTKMTPQDYAVWPVDKQPLLREVLLFAETTKNRYIGCWVGRGFATFMTDITHWRDLPPMPEEPEQ